MSIAQLVTHEGKENIAHIVMNGSIDESNLEELRSALRPHMDDSNINIIALDFTDVEYINSKVVGYIASLYTLGQVNNTKLVILGENKDIIDILSLVGLTTLIEQKKSIDEI